MVRPFCCTKKRAICSSCTVRAVTSDGITVEIVHNGRPVLRIFSAVYSPWPDTASGTVTLALDKGDNVWVRRLGHGRKLGEHHNFFSGILISAER